MTAHYIIVTLGLATTAGLATDASALSGLAGSTPAKRQASVPFVELTRDRVRDHREDPEQPRPPPSVGDRREGAWPRPHVRDHRDLPCRTPRQCMNAQSPPDKDPPPAGKGTGWQLPPPPPAGKGTVAPSLSFLSRR